MLGGGRQATGPGRRLIIATVAAGLSLAPAVALAGGALDKSFSKDGKVLTKLGGIEEEAVDVAITGGGRVLVAAETSIGNAKRLVVLRYRANGRLDRSFSGDGIAKARFPGFVQVRALGVQRDGRIVVGGHVATQASGRDFAVARFRPNGKLDRSFSGDGRRTVGFEGGDDDLLADLAIQPNGRIVLVGQSRQPPNSLDLAIARLRKGGGLDKKFSADGRVTEAFSAQVDRADAVAIQRDGRIVTAGTVDAGGAVFLFLMARFRPNGNLDTTFAGGSVTTSFLGEDDQAFGLAIQRNRRIVAAGFTGSTLGGPGEVALARYLPNGGLDSSFAGDGTKTVDVAPGAGDRAHDVAILAGRIVTAGFTGSAGPTGNDFLLLRLRKGGALDPSFAGDGIKTTEFGTVNDFANALAVRGKRIVAAGYSGDRIALARYKR
jgi:uncharacterized delta-60 repeat protein